MALGWDVYIGRQMNPRLDSTGKYRGKIGSWRASKDGGWSWAEALVAEGLAKSLGGNGYPYSYTITAAVLVEKIKSGQMLSSLVDESELAKCLPTEELLIEVWDRS